MQPTANVQPPPPANGGPKPARGETARRTAGLSDAQLRTLAEKVYRLLRDEARITQERQGR